MAPSQHWLYLLYSFQSLTSWHQAPQCSNKEVLDSLI